MSEDTLGRIIRNEGRIDAIDRRVTAHEDGCERRYREIKESVDSMREVMWKAAAAIIGLLITIVGFLLIQAWPAAPEVLP